MSIQFNQPRAVKLRHFQTRMEKHGDSDRAAMDLAISVVGGNELLNDIHPDLRLAFFKPVTENPGELSLPVDDLPSVRFPRISKPIYFDIEHAGMTLKIAYGASGKADMVLGAVKLSKLKVESFIEGGSVEIQFNLSTTDISEKVLGKLPLLQGHDIEITLTQPEVKDEPPKIDAKQPAGKAPPADAAGPEAAFLGTADTTTAP